MNRHVARALMLLRAGLACLLPAAACLAQEGSFDPTFGNGGRLVVGVSVLGTNDNMQRLVLRPDGRLLMGGTCDYKDDHGAVYSTFCVTQLRPDGTYDGNFGPGGVGYLQFNRFAGWPNNSHLYDMLVLRDGRIALLGVGTDNARILLAVVRADGSALDTGVGGGAGYLQFQFTNTASIADSLVQQPDGKLLVAGAAIGSNGNYDSAVARLLADLSGLDASFGSNGAQVVAFDLGGPGGDDTDVCNAVRLQPDGKIVLVGTGYTTPAGQPITGAQIELARLNSDGSRDLAFGGAGDGRMHYSAGHAVAVAYDAQIDAGGRIVIGGVVAPADLSNDQSIVDRLSRDGARDIAFNQGNPRIFIASPGFASAVQHLALTNDGIFAAGLTTRTAASNETAYFAVARFNIAGAFDARFGGGGQVYGSFTATNDISTDGTIDIAVGNGGVMVAGTQESGTSGNTTSRFAIGRLQYDQIFSDGFDFGGT